MRRTILRTDCNQTFKEAGGNSAGVISANAGTLTVTGSQTYSDAGLFALGVTVAKRRHGFRHPRGRMTVDIMSNAEHLAVIINVE